MIARAVLVAAALCLSGCASFAGTFDGWARLDRGLYDASVVCTMTDYLQTESALDEGYSEGNPVYGRHPSDDKLAGITAARFGALYLLADTMPAQWRTETFSLALLPCAAVVLHNHQLGARIRL